MSAQAHLSLRAAKLHAPLPGQAGGRQQPELGKPSRVPRHPPGLPFAGP